MKIIIGCELSQIICIAFRKQGHEAYSCDIEPCEGNHPKWHIQNDLRNVDISSFDLGIFHPPCTYLCVTGNKWMKPEFKDRFPNREQQRKDAIDFFMYCVNLPIEKICIENPIGIMSTINNKPDQMIQPYYFGDEAQKSTCLWLKNLPLLHHAKESDWFTEKTHVGHGEIHTCKSGNKMPKWYAYAPKKERSKLRSRTFPGIAAAMAEQWGGIID